MDSEKPPILHIIVVGFHHKLGCQVEFSYPPLIAGTTGLNECPSGWKYMPTLALPDGSHNFKEDSVFFNLPSLMEPTESVYGISCYRQIPVEKLKNRTADVTRSTVQKSVCILSRLPIYGYIEVKLSLIADAFFDQGDFANTDLLVKAYSQLNACLLDDESRRSLRHFHVGLSLRDIVSHWRQKTLILFKLFLLQRRVVFFGSPVRGMCTLILGVASLIPRLLEKGWQEVACVRTSRPLSPMPDFTESLQQESYIRELPVGNDADVPETEKTPGNAQSMEDECVGGAQPLELSNDEMDVDGCVVVQATAALHSGSGDSSPKSTLNSTSQSTRELNRLDSSESSELCSGKRSNSLTRESSVDTLATNLTALASVNPDEYRAPISIFASGNLCLPYLSLPYMDLLSDPSVLSYIIGTSNFLFQQKRQLSDVLVDSDMASIDFHDQELKRQLVLTTEDLRFMDFVMKHVQAPKEDGEGGECWIRDQFQGYILALLRSSVATDITAKEIEHFNAHFVSAFKRTQCYQEWYDVKPDTEFFDSLPSGHPFAGNLSVADVKLKFSQTMQNSESARKLNNAVNTTSRAVGGAISQAKGALSTWWSSMTTPPTIPAVVASNGANGVVEKSLADDGGPPEDQPEISVAFQNRKDMGDIVEEVVSIHMDSAKRLEGDGHSTASMSSNSDKPLDSAEELEEDNTTIQKLVETTRDEKACELITSTTTTKAPLEEKPVTSQGIVEIGREAEILNKGQSTASTTETQTLVTEPATCATGAASSNGAHGEHSHGDIFIV